MRLGDLYKVKIKDDGTAEVVANTSTPNNTIFAEMKAQFPLLNEINSFYDVEIISKYSNRPVHPLLKILFSDGHDMNRAIAKIILAKYQKKWQELFDALNIQYNPIENYNRKFTREQDENHTNTRTDNSQNTTETQISAFDSTVYEDSQKTTMKGNGSQVVDDMRIKTNRFEENTTGNIGVTTSQQMLQSEIDLRSRNMLSEVIKADIVKEITIPMY